MLQNLKIWPLLKKILNQVITDNTFNRYWLSYGLYNQALLAGIQEDEDRAEFLIDRAIELLNPFKDDIKYDAPYDYDGPEVKYIYPGNDPSI